MINASKHVVLCTTLLMICISRLNAAGPVPIYDAKLTPKDREMAEQAYGIFCQKCQPLMSSYAGDIERVEVSYSDSLDGPRDFGWSKQFQIMVKIKDRPKTIPFKTYAWGHNEYFDIGGPKNPGFSAGKHPILCGVKSGEAHMFISVPSLSFIKK